MKDKKYSEHLSEFLNFISDADKICKANEEEMLKQDKITQDILHSMELDELNYQERSKLATQLVLNRKSRRKCKDIVEELGPVCHFISTNKKIVNELTQLLGAVRKQEKYHNNRSYNPKILNKKENAK